MPPAPVPDSAPRSIVPGARGALILLLLINLLNYIDRFILAAVERPIRDSLLSGDPNPMKKTGGLATAFLVTYMLAAPVFGMLADRFSRWLLVGIAVILWSLAAGATGLATIFPMLVLARVFVGVGEAGYGPTAPTLIADYYPIEKRASVMAWFYMAVPLGVALGYGIGGFMEARLGWRSAFFVTVIPSIMLGAMALRRKDPPRGASDKTSVTKKASIADYLHLLRIRSYLLDTAGMTALTFAIGGISWWMPAYLEYRKAGSLAQVNMLFGGITALGGIIATLLGGFAGDRLRPRFPGSYFLVSGVAILISCPLILLMLITPFPSCWVVIFFSVFFLFFNTGPSNTILVNVTRPAVRATAFALNILLLHALGDVMSPPLLGGIIESTPARDNWNMAFVVVAAVTFIAGILWLLGIPHLKRDTDAALA
ncbi:MAG: spinster family MFS transporter [Tepidisphaerales bacterium]